MQEPKKEIILDGVGLYYSRILAYFDAVGNFNRVRSVYDRLDQWMPPRVAKVFNESYDGDRKTVIRKYREYHGEIDTTWKSVKNSLDELGLSYTEADLRTFQTLSKSTLDETKFRPKVRRHVETLHKNVNKEIVRRNNGEKPKPIHAKTPGKLIAWYQEHAS